MISLHIHIPAVPVAQPRQRHAVMGGSVRSYMPSSHPIAAFKASVRLAASQAYSGPPMDGPLMVSLTFVFPRPKGMVWKKRPMPRVRHTGRPDLDNLMKAFFDSLNKVLWIDDAQVCSCTCSKFIACGTEQPHVEATISEIVDDVSAKGN